MPVMKLGLIYCINRPTQLYHIKEPIFDKKKWTENTEKDAYMRQINPENEFLAMHPRFTHDFTALAYIARDEKFLSHTTNYQMKMMSWPQEETPVSETIVDRYPDYPSKDTEFCGFYGYNDTYSLS